MLENPGWIQVSQVVGWNEMRVVGDKLPADAFVGIVENALFQQNFDKVRWPEDKRSFDEVEAERVRVMSEFRRLTGRAEAPMFGYAAVPGGLSGKYGKVQE